MFSLTHEPTDKIKLSNGKTYKLHLSYQDVLKWYEMLDDTDLSDVEKVVNSFSLFVGDVPNIALDEQAKAVSRIEQIIVDSPYGDHQSEAHSQSSTNKRYFSYTKDAAAIYASFFYDYKIDLLENVGMRWDKFQALFNNLSAESPIMRIINIRQTDTSKLQDEELSRMLELQSYYALDQEDTAHNLENDINSMFNTLKLNSKRKGD